MLARAFLAIGVALSLLTATAPVAADPPPHAGPPEDAGHGPPIDDAAPHVPGRVLVGVEPGAHGEAERAVTARGGHVHERYEPGDILVVELPSHARAPEWARALRAEVPVRFAEPDYALEADDVTPNDAQWSSQWGPPKVALPQAWETTTGSSDVVVAVIDSGVDYTHEDIGTDRMWRNPREVPDGKDNDGNGFADDLYGADCRNRDGDPRDDNDHGTHVAGIIGAATDNARGVAGTAWNVRIMALKFLDAGARGSTLDAIRCLDYAVANGARISNNSWGGGAYSVAMRDALARARAAGHLFVASAGNSGLNTDEAAPNYPSGYDLDNVLSVAASTSLDGVATFSNYGPLTVDLAAPGQGILSTVRGNTYASKSGTSMAAPHVTGAAALVMAAFPGTAYGAIVARLRASVDRTASLEEKLGSGGRLNVARAVETDTRSPGTPSMWALPALATRTSVSLAWMATDDDGGAGTQPASAYDLQYRPLGAAAWAPGPAPWPGRPGTVQTATIRGLRPGRTYEVSLAARDNVGNASVPATALAGTAAGREVFVDDFEGAPSWSAGGPWALSGERTHGPGRAWTDSPGGPYAGNVDASVVSPPFSLAGARNPTITLWQRHSFERGRDSGRVEISTNGGTAWATLATYTGGTDWIPSEIDLRPYAGAPSARIRLRITTDATNACDGWFVDDVVVSSDP